MAQSLTYRLVSIFPFSIEVISINDPIVGLDIFMRLFDHNRIIFQVFFTLFNAYHTKEIPRCARDDGRGYDSAYLAIHFTGLLTMHCSTSSTSLLEEGLRQMTCQQSLILYQLCQ